MTLFLTAALIIWGLGWAVRLPRRLRWSLIALLYGAVVLATLVLPEASSLRASLGGSTATWLTVGGMVALAGLYAWGLKQLRKRVRPENRAPAEVPTPTHGPLSDAELDRYARHIVLREIGGAGQRRLREARVLVIGAGGLGSPVLQYLAAAGVGTIGVIDDDLVEATNLQRQVIHSEKTVGMPKVFSAAEALRGLNPFVTVQPYNRRLTPEVAKDLIAGHDLVLDGCDNFETRYLVNRVCAAQGVPLIGGAIAQWEGQLSVWDPARGAPCYQCVFPQAPAPGLAPSCAEAGVIGPLPGVIGAMMALEAVKILTGAGTPLRGELLIHDGLYGESRRIHLRPRPDCPVCGGGD